ncbi:MAG TPA: sialidase family protein, partial [Ktedonobacterales bacterium]
EDAMTRLPFTRNPRSSAPHARTAGRVRGVIAVAVAAALIAAFAGVFLTSAPGRQRGPASTPVQATATASPALTRGKWSDLTKLDASPSFSDNDVPAIAPGHPEVVYQTFAAGLQQHQPAHARRTEDGGQHWTNLPLPVAADHVGYAGMAVSPLNAHTVYLTVIDTTPADCPANRLVGNSEGGFQMCWLQFTSTDSGMHWAPTRLPVTAAGAPGVLLADVNDGGAAPILDASLHAQGSRLYAGFSCTAPQSWSCLRLVTSEDGGLTWQFADAELMGAASAVCDMVVDPHGSAVYAVTSAGDCNYSYRPMPLTFWRSSDAGAHWARVGTLATPFELGMRMGADENGHPTLYAAMPRVAQTITNKMGGQTPILSSAPGDLIVSGDGGQTWQHAPSAGIPSGYKPDYEFGPLGTLPDGSVIVPMIPQDAESNVSGLNQKGTMLFAWQAGQRAWRQIAPNLVGEMNELVVTPSPGGQGTRLTLVLVNRSGSDPTFTFMRIDL